MTTMTIPCNNCIESHIFDPEQLGRLVSRDHDLRRIMDLSFDEIGANEPVEWFPRIVASVSAYGVIRPILLSRKDEELELIDGNHRAWAAYTQQIDVPVQVFTPVCGDCTEETFLESFEQATEGSEHEDQEMSD